MLFGKEIDETPDELQRWGQGLAALVRERREEFAGLAPWLEHLRAMPATGPDEPIAAGRWQDLRKLLIQPLSVAALHAQVEAIQTDLARWRKSLPDAEERSHLSA